MKKSLHQWLLAGSVVIAACACQQKKSDRDQPSRGCKAQPTLEKSVLKPTAAAESEKAPVKEVVKKVAPEASQAAQSVQANLEKKAAPGSDTAAASINLSAVSEAKADGPSKTVMPTLPAGVSDQTPAAAK